MKTALMLEGGGMRGFYTIGVLDCLMRRNICVDYVVGVSAGACHGVSYVSRQRGRSLRVNRAYCHDKRYLSFSNFAKTGSIFGMDFIFREIPDELDPFDYEAFSANPTDMEVGVTDIQTGEAVFFGKEALVPGARILEASSSIPCFAPSVPIDGALYLDGGTASPLPVTRALERGCDRVLAVLTQPRGFIKKPEKLTYYRRQYRDYPQLVRTMDERHHIYNGQVTHLRALEQQGMAMVIAPPRSLGIGRFDTEWKLLRSAYLQGYVDTQIREEAIRSFLAG